MSCLPRDGDVLGNAGAAQRRRYRQLRKLQPHPGDGLKVLRLFTDGASRGNPGPAGLGVVIEDDLGMRLRGLHRWLGVTTNNEAEYRALIEGLKAAQDWKPDRLEVYLDSKLVVEQINGGYRIKAPELLPLHKQAKELIEKFPEVKVAHVERAKNRGADHLANMAIDAHVKKTKFGG
ncbi:MAG: ribonuclease HI family protein [Chloroflexi bacterium]|nr:MAG: ribonuclease HI family protein [Chloroflexota bacterium]